MVRRSGGMPVATVELFSWRVGIADCFLCNGISESDRARQLKSGRATLHSGVETFISTIASRSLQKTGVSQPFLEPRQPASYRFAVACADPKAMSAAAINVQFRRHPGALEAKIRLGQSLGDVLPVIVGAGKEHRRGFLHGVDLSGTARINQRLKRRPRTVMVHFVGRVFDPVV